MIDMACPGRGLRTGGFIFRLFVESHNNHLKAAAVTQLRRDRDWITRVINDLTDYKHAVLTLWVELRKLATHIDLAGDGGGDQGGAAFLQ
jgi:hypothetical protein